jgi:hypothetical protein
MRERFAANCEASGLDPDERLSEFLGEDRDTEEFWETAHRNLQDGKIRLLFVADEIPTELQRVVEFLNEQMDHTQVLAIEIKQFIGEGQTGLVPRVIGQTAEAIIKKGPEAQVDEGVIERLPADVRNVARQILDWSSANFTRVNWRDASFVTVLEYGADFSHNPITVYCRGKLPRVGIKFGRMKKRNGLSDDKRLQLLRRLNKIPGVNLPESSLDKFPNIPLSTLTDDNALGEFLKAIAWTIEEVKAAHQPQATTVLSQSAQS